MTAQTTCDIIANLYFYVFGEMITINAAEELNWNHNTTPSAKDRLANVKNLKLLSFIVSQNVLRENIAKIIQVKFDI